MYREYPKHTTFQNLDFSFMTVQEKLINKEYDFLIVGAGISGIVMAERLASVGKKILLIDKRDHFGGNCFDYKEKGIMVQKYGPHIFHTKYLEVFKYLSGFTRWNSYRHKVLAWHNKRLYPMPINRTTLNRFFDLDLKDETEVRKFLATKKVRFGKIKNAEDFILSRFGEELNEAFFKHYSRKVWGVSLDKIDSSVVRRLPIRYDDNDLYFNDEQQGLPTPSFSAMFAKMLGNKNITVKLKTDYFEISDQIRYKTLIFTGEIDLSLIHI